MSNNDGKLFKMNGELYYATEVESGSFCLTNFTCTKLYHLSRFYSMCQDIAHGGDETTIFRYYKKRLFLKRNMSINAQVVFDNVFDNGHTGLTKIIDVIDTLLAETDTRKEKLIASCILRYAKRNDQDLINDLESLILF
ncbi:MAG: hypothetical protein KAI39_12145 [Desulfobulbaceae bacterium]|nr:hypothetical protein [Desulfobulbaceae bacterium]